MTIAAFEVKIDNEDRGTHSTKFFSNIYDAQRFYDKYACIVGDSVLLLQIGTKAVLSEK